MLSVARVALLFSRLTILRLLPASQNSSWTGFSPCRTPLHGSSSQLLYQPLLRSLHWLRVPERISFQLAVLVYRCLHGSAHGYLASDLQRVSDLNPRRRLRSSSTSAARVGPPTQRATIGDRTFPAAAASVWNSLPESVRPSPSLPVSPSSLTVFRSRLKTELCTRSYNCSD